MRKNMRCLVAALLVLALAMSAGLALADTTITVSGSGVTLVTADTAVVSLGVMARNKEVLQAQAKVNETIAAIRAVLTDLGIEEENINTDYINIYAMYDYSNDMEEITAYNANSTLAIKLTDVAMVGRVIDTAFEAGANTLNGIEFSASDSTEAREEAMRKAVADAKRKAEVLAQAAGLTLKEIVTIQETGVYSYDSGANNFSMKAAGMETVEEADRETVVQAAKLNVTANVTVTFEAVEN